jgi:hypothetical protein
MGQAASVLKAFSCDAMWKYVCNAQHLKSRCCGDFCEVEYTTEMVDISDSETEIEITGCCSARST